MKYNLLITTMLILLIAATVAMIRDARPYDRGSPDSPDNFISAPLDLESAGD